jgi:hypothetical protein
MAFKKRTMRLVSFRIFEDTIDDLKKMAKTKKHNGNHSELVREILEDAVNKSVVGSKKDARK